MNGEILSLDELINAARQARDQRLFDAARASFERDTALEAEVSTITLVQREAQALGERMIKLIRPLRLGHGAIELSRRDIKKNQIIDSGIYVISTPILFQLQKEVVGDQEITNGWRFDTVVQHNSILPKKLRHQVAWVGAYGVTQELTEGLQKVQPEFTVQVNVPKPDKAQFESRLVRAQENILKNSDEIGEAKDHESQMYEKYALLRLARQELGDRSAD